MSETAPAEKTEPVNAGELLAELAAFWASPSPGRYDGRVPSRIAGGPHDQLVPAGTRNPYWDIIRQIPLSVSFMSSRPEPDAYFFTLGTQARLLTDRGHLCATFAWSVPSPGDIAWITSRLGGRGIVEPGAGGGYWAWQLAQAGADVVAYEPEHPGDNEFVACNCGVGPSGYYGAHESGCGLEPCPRGCPYVPPTLSEVS